METTQRCMKLVADFVGTDHFIAVDKQLGVMNNRLYRQSRTYNQTLKVEPGFTGHIDVYVLRNTWMTKNAIKAAHRAYTANIEDELEVAGEQKGRWHDFRMDIGLTGFGELKPVAFDGQLTPAIWNPLASGATGEYRTSRMHDENSNDWSFTIAGSSDYNQRIYSIFDEYNRMRNAPQNPLNPPAVVGYEQVREDDFDEDILDRLKFDGDQPPYHPTGEFAGGIWQYVGCLGVDPTTGAQRLSTGAFDAPLGVIALKGYGTSTPADAELCLHLTAGNYKGVKATSLLE